MSRKIKLGKTYITTFGKEFIPVEFIRGKLTTSRYAGNANLVGQREESRYIDKNDNRIRKSKLSHIKGEEPPKKLKSTI